LRYVVPRPVATGKEIGQGGEEEEARGGRLREREALSTLERELKARELFSIALLLRRPLFVLLSLSLPLSLNVFRIISRTWRPEPVASTVGAIVSWS
jgi:hypothetical protein